MAIFLFIFPVDHDANFLKTVLVGFLDSFKDHEFRFDISEAYSGANDLSNKKSLF